MVFPVVMYGCESWTIKKAEHWRTDAFELWFWRRLLRVPWTARRSNQSTLKEISPDYSLEGLMLKLKLHYFGHLMQRTDSLEKTLMLGKIEGGRRRGWQRMRWWMTSLTCWTRVWLSLGSWWQTRKTCVLWFMGSQRVGHNWATELNQTDMWNHPVWTLMMKANSRHESQGYRKEGVLREEEERDTPLVFLLRLQGEEPAASFLAPYTAHEGPWENNNLELRTQSHELENEVKTKLKQEALGINTNGWLSTKLCGSKLKRKWGGFSCY